MTQQDGRMSYGKFRELSFCTDCQKEQPHLVRTIFSCEGNFCHIILDNTSQIHLPFNQDFNIEGFVRFLRSSGFWEAIVWNNGMWVLAESNQTVKLEAEELAESETYLILIKIPMGNKLLYDEEDLSVQDQRYIHQHLIDLYTVKIEESKLKMETMKMETNK